MCRLIRGFAGHIYHIVENLMPWLNLLLQAAKALMRIHERQHIYIITVDVILFYQEVNFNAKDLV